MSDTTFSTTTFLDNGAAKLERVEDVAETMAGICFMLNGMRHSVSERSLVMDVKKSLATSPNKSC